MKDFKIKTKVKKPFNDGTDNNKPYEENEPIILERARYEELLSKGFVYKGEEVKENTKKKKEKEEKIEDENIDRL